MAESVTVDAGAPSRELSPSVASGGLVDRSRGWLSCRREHDALRASTRPLPPVKADAVRFARDALAGATRLLSPIYPVPFGSDAALAVTVLGDALFWALAAQPEAEDATELSALIESPALEAALASGGVAGERLRALRSGALVGDRSAQYRRSAVLLTEDAAAAMSVVNALLERADASALGLGRIRRTRALRVGMAILVAVALLAVGTRVGVALVRRGDLARDKPWTASSNAYTCTPAEGICGGTKTKIFFHTNDEESPWVQIDLGAVRSFSRVDVRNRADCCMDRAAPLIVEIGEDGKTFRKVARREEPFFDWSAKLGDQTARYVRLRADKKTILHLEKIEVRLASGSVTPAGRAASRASRSPRAARAARRSTRRTSRACARPRARP